jgi:hypothetical protein
MADGPQATFSGAKIGDLGTQSARFVPTDQFLTTVGRAIVRSQLETS